MRRILVTVFLFVLVTSELVSQSSGNNNIIFFTEKGRRFTLYFNEEKINTIPQVNVKVFAVGDGWQKVKVELENESTPIVDSLLVKAFAKNLNKEFTYVVRESAKKDLSRYTLDFVGMSDLSGPKVPIVPEVPENLRIVDTIMFGKLYGTKNKRPIFFTNYDNTSTKCMASLSDIEIGYAADLIKKTNDLQDKYKYTETIIEKNCYSSGQLTQILIALDIEMDKLKLAKRAYPHLIDPENAKQVSAAFKYNAVKEDYNGFLSEGRKARSSESIMCTDPAPEKEFDILLSEIKKSDSEYERIKSATKMASANCFSTEQVKQFMGTFAHDRERFEFFKAVFPVITDKGKVDALVESFQFSESKSEFSKYLEGKK